MNDDFTAFGLRGPTLVPSERQWLLTLDFEAFTPEDGALWCRAMHCWADHCRAGGWRFVFFVSVEDVVRLRVADRPLYERFLEAVADLHRAGVDFHPHNHCVFDPATGERPTPADELARRRVNGYSKGASMYYDVAYRNGRTFRDWLPTVVQSYVEFLRDAGIEQPALLGFRSGGWDYGSTKTDVTDYVEALLTEGFAFESGAASGTYGKRGWRIGAPFGSNTFVLRPPLVEIAPTDFLNCGAATVSIPFLGWLSRIARQPRLWAPPLKPGVLVTVLHFDNLFHSGHGKATTLFAVKDPEEAVRRIAAFFARMAFFRRLLKLESCTFSELTDLSQRSRDADAGRALT